MGVTHDSEVLNRMFYDEYSISSLNFLEDKVSTSSFFFFFFFFFSFFLSLSMSEKQNNNSRIP